MTADTEPRSNGMPAIERCRCHTLLVRLGVKPAPPVYAGVCRRCGKPARKLRLYA